MAGKKGGVWAIDLGNNSLKAIHLDIGSNGVEVTGFENIQHSKILTGSDIGEGEKDELIALSLRQFVSQNDLSDEEIIISVSSQSSFARFVNLPPVERKKIPEIVTFEASQQIPFDINSVQWSWQLMGETESGENKVGIFAIKNEDINSLLAYFGGEEIQVSYVQIAPMALYNYALYDYAPLLEMSKNNGVIVLDIGAENSDLVVCTKETVWQRSIPMGGNTFTQAIAESFKLNFAKAEKLKRTAAVSKYARQIFQAMKPVFTDFVSEVQRSLNFYSRSNPDTKFCKVIAIGGGAKMRGLPKYLQQILQVPVEQPDAFKMLTIGSETSAAKFHESVSDFGVVYGLGLQVLGLGKIESNLLPRSVSRSIAWEGKAKFFIAAAILLFLVSVLSFARTFIDKLSYNNQSAVRQQVGNIITDTRQAKSRLSNEESKSSKSQSIIQEAKESYQYRNVIPQLNQTILSTLPNAENAVEQDQKELHQAFYEGQISKILDVPRKERKQIFITSMAIRFSDDVSMASFESTAFLAGGSRQKGKTERRGAGGRRRGISAEMMKRLGGDLAAQLKQQQKRFNLRSVQKRSGETVKTEAVARPGFVVSLAGYTPYKKPFELMDPTGVKNDPDKWGFITRLMYLDEFLGHEIPFRLYLKSEKRHFDLMIAPIDRTKDYPVGIGIDGEQTIKTRDGNETIEIVLEDPMTKEIISTVAPVDSEGLQKSTKTGEVEYEVNDHWFTLDMKFVWEKTSEQSSEDSSSSG